ncbi:unnamed protein product [Larinioides sclopetarius]|uniref:Uncharacterized protein n=1 Tax=Larinioides sclopetarius TaxID=280406 RepID=A0AAV1Z480_9ARAC
MRNLMTTVIVPNCCVCGLLPGESVGGFLLSATDLSSTTIRGYMWETDQPTMWECRTNNVGIRSVSISLGEYRLPTIQSELDPSVFGLLKFLVEQWLTCKDEAKTADTRVDWKTKHRQRIHSQPDKFTIGPSQI